MQAPGFGTPEVGTPEVGTLEVETPEVGTPEDDDSRERTSNLQRVKAPESKDSSLRTLESEDSREWGLQRMRTPESEDSRKWRLPRVRTSESEGFRGGLKRSTTSGSKGS